MIKASALSLVDGVESTAVSYNKTEISGLIRNNQNMIIESVKEAGEIPESIANLALRMLDHDEVFKDIINELRTLYGSKRDDFHISLAGKTKEEKEQIISLLQDMYGIISYLHYIPETEMLNGKIIFSTKALMFITGRYLEIGVYEKIRKILEDLSRKYSKEYMLYKNVRVATKEGKLKNEFDIVIEFNGIFYVLEIKSGKNFRDFDKYMDIGKEYRIVPGRFLLIDSYLTTYHANTIEYFCDYYVSNLIGDSLENKVTMMIENDLKGGN